LFVLGILMFQKWFGVFVLGFQIALCCRYFDIFWIGNFLGYFLKNRVIFFSNLLVTLCLTLVTNTLACFSKAATKKVTLALKIPVCKHCLDSTKAGFVSPCWGSRWWSKPMPPKPTRRRSAGQCYKPFFSPSMIERVCLCQVSSSALAGKSNWSGKLSTVGLLVLTTKDPLILMLKILITFFTKQFTLMRRSTALNLPLQLVFRGISYYYSHTWDQSYRQFCSWLNT